MTSSLADSAVLVVGVGGLGCPAALGLALGGVGTIGLADGDRVELSNLHRQLLHTAADLGSEKASSASEKLRRFAPVVRVHGSRVTRSNVAETFSRYDFVIDATDDPASKYLLNDAAVLLGKPLCHAGASGLEGQILTVLPGKSACLRCLFPVPPSEEEIVTCRDGGILGPLAGLLGALEAEEALKFLRGSGELFADRLLSIDARSLRFREVPIRRSPHCPLCGPRATIRELLEHPSHDEERP